MTAILLKKLQIPKMAVGFIFFSVVFQLIMDDGKVIIQVCNNFQFRFDRILSPV